LSGIIIYERGQYGKIPIFLEMENRRVVVIGGGSVAFRKVQILLDAGRTSCSCGRACRSGPRKSMPEKQKSRTVKAPYSKEYLAGATLAIAATNNRELNKQIFHDCQELDVLCNVVDDPELCDFFTPAVIKRGDLQIAVSTDGLSPAYAGHIKKKLEEMFTETHANSLANWNVCGQKS